MEAGLSKLDDVRNACLERDARHRALFEATIRRLTDVVMQADGELSEERARTIVKAFLRHQRDSLTMAPKDLLM